MKYTLIHPSFDPPEAKSPRELKAIADLFSSGETFPFVNYWSLEEGPIHLLSREFLDFLCSFKFGSNPFLDTIGKRRGVKEMPLSACGAQSATAGIAAALMTKGVGQGEVITTSLNFLGVPNAVMLAGAAPKFVDIDPDTLCMDMKSLEKAIGKETKAVLLVHFNQVVDIEPIDEIFERLKLDIPLVQDASLAMGSDNKGMPAGLVNLGGGATVYSFATSKTLSGLGGAIVVANDKTIIERIQTIGYQGMNFANPEELSSFGANFKMNDLNAVIVLEQLKKRVEIFEKRRKLKSWYDRELADFVDTGKIAIQKVGSGSIVTHYAILVPDRRAIAKKMADKGVMLGFWHACHLQKIYQDRFGTGPGTLPVTESVANRITFLPFHTKLTEKDVSFICKSLKEVL